MTADPTSFTRFQQLLLGTDGTVTHLLEAYAGEPIEVVKLLQEFDTSPGGDGDLDLPEGGKVLRRQAVLRGARSRQILLYAEAVVAVGRVEAAFIDGLVGTDKPIGALLAEARTETFREILRVGREPAGASGAHFGLDMGAPVVARTYRIVKHGRPMIVITERFPTECFRTLPC